MATIVTREIGATAKGSPLTNAELDNNFINLNNSVIELESFVESIETFVSWDSSTDLYDVYASGETSIHRKMKRCLLLDNGTVNYYLDAIDSSRKANGAASTLTGVDGQVMVEIPKFYIKKTKISNLNTWFISEIPRTGYTLHPAFIKNGVEVDFRYYGAYDACFFDTTDRTYKSGLNLDNASSLIDTVTDKLASISNAYPLVGVTRAECRALAKNRGTGWRQIDQYLVHAVQLLYLTEYGNFNSQAKLGSGNTNGSYLASSSIQSDSPHTIAGSSNSFGNNSTNVLSGASINVKPGTSFMSYRGIENFFGNCWNWVDGFNVINYQVWLSNTDTTFTDDTSANYTPIGSTVPTTNNYVTNIQDLPQAFLPSAVGGTSATFITDYFYSASGNRVALFGGSAGSRSNAGAFCWSLNNVSSSRTRDGGARLAF